MLSQFLSIATNLLLETHGSQPYYIFYHNFKQLVSSLLTSHGQTSPRDHHLQLIWYLTILVKFLKQRSILSTLKLSQPALEAFLEFLDHSRVGSGRRELSVYLFCDLRPCFHWTKVLSLKWGLALG